MSDYAFLYEYTGLQGFKSRLPGIIENGGIGYPRDSIDYIQLFNHIRYSPETDAYLYLRTPSRPNHIMGSRPILEKVVEGLITDNVRNEVKVEKILKWIMENTPHVYICGKEKECTLGYISEEIIVKRGYGFCNELARLFCNLCYISAIPARVLFLYHLNGESGHVIAEAYIDGEWAACDPSAGWLFGRDDNGCRINARSVLCGKSAREKVKQLPFRILFKNGEFDDDFYANLFNEFAIYEYE